MNFRSFDLIGLAMVVGVLILFFGVGVETFGLWAIPAGIVFVLFAGRPTHNGGPFIWQAKP